MENLIAVLIVFCLIAPIAGCTDTSASDNTGSRQPEIAVEKNRPELEGQSQFKNISPDEAKKALDLDKSIILLDVRTSEEYNEGHIPGSILVPVDSLESQILTTIPDKKTKIFIYCRSGNRSKTAAQIMINLGYTDVYDLGGIKSWPYEIEK